MSDLAIDAARVAPPVGVAASTAMGLSLQEWVYVVTILYTVIQIAITVYNFIQKRKLHARK